GDELDRVDHLQALVLEEQRRVLTGDPVVRRDVAQHGRAEGRGGAEVGDVARVERVEAAADHRHPARERRQLRGLHDHAVAPTVRRTSASPRPPASRAYWANLSWTPAKKTSSTSRRRR